MMSEKTWPQGKGWFLRMTIFDFKKNSQGEQGKPVLVTPVPHIRAPVPLVAIPVLIQLSEKRSDVLEKTDNDGPSTWVLLPTWESK